MDAPQLDRPEIWLDLANGKLAAARDLLRLGHCRETTHESDYQPRAVITADSASRILADAEEFVALASGLVREGQP